MADVLARGRTFKAADEGGRKPAAPQAEAAPIPHDRPADPAIQEARAAAELAFKQTLDAVDERMSTQRRLEVQTAMNNRLLDRLMELRLAVEADPYLKEKLGGFFDQPPT